MSTVLSPATPVPAGTWVADASHTTIGFAVRHMGIATVRGEFREFEGALEIGGDASSARAWGTVKAASVDTGEPKRDEHLRSADFFDVAAHPELTFASRRIEPVDGDAFRIVGDLTMHGVTQEIVLTAEVQGADVDPWGNERVGLEITGELSRGAFGMKFNQALGSGNALVADKVRLVLDVSAVKRA